MRLCILTLAAFALIGCGAARQKEASSPSPDYDWGDYKGTYASGDAPKDAPKEAAKDTPKDAPKETKESKSDAAAAASLASASSSSSKKTSHAKIHGESVSQVSLESVAAMLKTKLKSRVTTQNLLVGQEYEQLQVVSKKATVQIIRPATNPDSNGPKVRSPKTRNDGLSAAEVAWYDEEADVLVLVQAAKKAASKRVLTALLKR